MTELELNKARKEYREHLEGQKKLLECMASYKVRNFTRNFCDLTEEKVRFLAEEEILRKTFLQNFSDTKESSNLWVFLNFVGRKSKEISDGQAVIESVSCFDTTDDSINIYSLYCDLENNQPFLVDKIGKDVKTIVLAELNNNKESYYYNSNSLEKITKGSKTLEFDALQLYYFEQLLENSREEAVGKVMDLTIKKSTKSHR